MHNAHYGVKREMCEKHIIFDTAPATCELWDAEKQEAPGVNRGLRGQYRAEMIAAMPNRHQATFNFTLTVTERERFIALFPFGRCAHAQNGNVRSTCIAP